MPFKNKATEYFQNSDMEDLLGIMFAYTRTQVENTQMPEVGVLIEQIMHLYLNIFKLLLKRCSFYTEFSEWIAKTRAVINQKIIMKSTSNKLLWQHYLRKRFRTTQNTYKSSDVININTIDKDSIFN